MKKTLNSCDGAWSNSIDVRFTKTCDNACAFCIEANGCDNLKMNVDKLIQTTIQELQSDKKDTVLILGGEPLLYQKEVLKYCKAIRPYTKEIYLTTSLPNTINHDYETFSKIMNELTGINLSIQHHSSDINNAILKASSKHNRLELLEKICSNELFAKKARVSINLVKGYMDNKTDLDTCLSLFQSIGVKHVKINELQRTPDLYISFESITGKKLKNAFTHGCQREIKYENFNMKITLKRSCFVVEPSCKANIQCLLKIMKQRIQSKNKETEPFIVIYENGQASNGWMTNKK